MSKFPLFDGKRILVTGGSGTIGNELIRHLANCTNAKTIRILTNDEDGLHKIGTLLKSDDNVRLLLGDVRDRVRLQRACEDIDLVFHLAALKHVYLSEYNPFESVSTNVIGTQNIIDAAIANEVEKVILTSSDKAANPSSVLGATKLLAEKLVTAANIMRGKKNTIFSSVRLGNVVGSRGSVVHLIKQDIIAKKKGTLTHPDMTRFIMRAQDAVMLLVRACHLMRGGEVFISKMPSIRISDLFSAVAKHVSTSETDVNDDLGYDIIGPKPGEKIHEDLFTEEESSRTVELDDLYIILANIPDLMKNVYDFYSTLGAKKAPIAAYNSETAGRILDCTSINAFISTIEF